ncbi:MAG TPA: vWA domain-containing protein [Polyangia bacterium]|nr:vWA domain-containing protein [Polyangia bacterium]
MLQRSAFLVGVFALVLGGCGFSPGPTEVSGGGGSSGGHISLGGSFGTGGARAGSSGTNPDAGCFAVNQGATRLPPDILIIQDKSGSMDDSADGKCTSNCGSKSKWSQVTTALNQVVGMTDQTVNWGLKFFSDNGHCAANGAPAVPVGPGHATMISSAIGKTSPGGNTPTRDAVATGAAYLKAVNDTNPKYLLLATDGLPNCPAGCSLTNPSMACTMTDNPAEDKAATDAVAAAGLPTFVIGVGMTGADATLNAMAIAGGVPQTGAATSFYSVSDTASLVTALNAILGRVASCKFDIGTAPNAMTNVNQIDVFGDGTLISKDPNRANGWDYTNPDHTAIEVFGPKCDDILSGAIKTVTVTFRCVVG